MKAPKTLTKLGGLVAIVGGLLLSSPNKSNAETINLTDPASSVTIVRGDDTAKVSYLNKSMNDDLLQIERRSKDYNSTRHEIIKHNNFDTTYKSDFSKVHYRLINSGKVGNVHFISFSIDSFGSNPLPTPDNEYILVEGKDTTINGNNIKLLGIGGNLNYFIVNGGPVTETTMNTTTNFPNNISIAPNFCFNAGVIGNLNHSLVRFIYEDEHTSIQENKTNTTNNNNIKINYQNPQPNTGITFSANGKGNYHLNIVDVLGRNIYSDNGKLQGEKQFSYSGNLPTGTYFLMLNNNGNKVVKKITKTK
jgi:hypothetical protein